MCLEKISFYQIVEHHIVEDSYHYKNLKSETSCQCQMTSSTYAISMVMPSFSHVSHGRGLPLAAQSSVMVLPSITTDDRGVVTNTGGIMSAPASANQ
jgi:hypothetical protein